MEDGYLPAPPIVTLASKPELCPKRSNNKLRPALEKSVALNDDYFRKLSPRPSGEHVIFGSVRFPVSMRASNLERPESAQEIAHANCFVLRRAFQDHQRSGRALVPIVPTKRRVCLQLQS